MDKKFEEPGSDATLMSTAELKQRTNISPIHVNSAIDILVHTKRVALLFDDGYEKRFKVL